MRKILFVTDSLSIGGVEKVLITICNALIEKDFDITIITLFPGEKLRPQLDKRIKVIATELRELPLMRRIPYIRYRFFGKGKWEKWASARRLYHQYVKDRYDVEVGFFRGLAVKIVSGSDNPYSKKIAWVHNDFRKCTGIQNFFHSIDEVKRAYEKYDVISCVSKEAREGFVDVIGCANAAKTVYNPISVMDINQKKNEPIEEKKDKFLILSVGRLFVSKSFDRLILAAKTLKDDGYDIEVWIVGEGNEREKLENLIKEKQVDNVKLLGSRDNPYAYMNIADLYVCSSIWEGFNLTVAEALACGLPVVSTKCTGPSEILQNGKYGLIVDNSIEGLVEGIKSLMDSDELRMKYRETAVSRANDFDIDNRVDSLIALFQNKTE